MKIGMHLRLYIYFFCGSVLFNFHMTNAVLGLNLHTYMILRSANVLFIPLRIHISTIGHLMTTSVLIWHCIHGQWLYRSVVW